jgi:hypothetical protein
LLFVRLGFYTGAPSLVCGVKYQISQHRHRLSSRFLNSIVSSATMLKDDPFPTSPTPLKFDNNKAGTDGIEIYTTPRLSHQIIITGTESSSSSSSSSAPLDSAALTSNSVPWSVLAPYSVGHVSHSAKDSFVL